MRMTTSAWWGFGLGLVLLPGLAQALPNFAREYGMNCGLCHSQVPQLNRTGYEFRLAGYRMPDEIGKGGKMSEIKLGDVFAARLQATYTDNRHDDVDPAKDRSSSQLELKDITLYPLTGSWAGNYASLVELSMSPDEDVEVENAFVRGVAGNRSGWFQARLGVMHPWEGFGASDRPIGLSRPLFQTQKATGSPFVLWNLDEVALELGYHFAESGTSVAARVGNGIFWKTDGSGAAEAAQGGELTKPEALPARNAKSYQLFLNQILRRESGFSLVYYRTTIPSPNPYDSLGNLKPGPFTTDTLERLAVYANVYVLPRTVNVLAGYGYGRDQLDDSTLAPQVGDNRGWFGEVDYFALPQKLAVGARYDRFDPSRKLDHNRLDAISAFANYMLVDGLQLIGEYQRKTAEAGSAPGSNDDDQLQIKVVLIF